MNIHTSYRSTISSSRGGTCVRQVVSLLLFVFCACIRSACLRYQLQHPVRLSGVNARAILRPSCPILPNVCLSLIRVKKVEGYLSRAQSKSNNSRPLEPTARHTKMDDKLPRTTNAPTETGVSEDFLPGTRLLIDQNHVVQTAHATGEIVLLPPPTDHPNDPLNWSTTRIYFGIFVACFWTMLLAAMAIIPNVTYGALIVELGASVGYLNTGAAVSLLFFGVGNLFWNPLVSNELAFQDGHW